MRGLRKIVGWIKIKYQTLCHWFNLIVVVVVIYVWNEWCEWVCSLIRRDVWFLRYIFSIWSLQRQDPLDSFTSIGRLKEKWFDDSNFGPLSSIQLFSQHTHQCRCCVFVFHFVVCVSFLEISLSGLFFIFLNGASHIFCWLLFLYIFFCIFICRYHNYCALFWSLIKNHWDWCC